MGRSVGLSELLTDLEQKPNKHQFNTSMSCMVRGMQMCEAGEDGWLRVDPSPPSTQAGDSPLDPGFATESGIAMQERLG